MAVRSKKLTKDMSVDELVQYFVEYQPLGFEERIKAFEEFHNPENEIPERFDAHVEYVIQGKEGDDNQKGAYRAATGFLHKKLKNDTDKLQNKEDVEKLIETYLDSFLGSHIHGKEFKKKLAEARRNNLSEQDIRKMKSQFFQKYLLDPRTGKPVEIDVFSDDYIGKFKGKSKSRVLALLKELVSYNTAGYRSHLEFMATGNLFKQHDEADMATYMRPIFDKAGLKHDDDLLLKDIRTLRSDYEAHLTGEDMTRRGYRKHKPQGIPEGQLS